MCSLFLPKFLDSLNQIDGLSGVCVCVAGGGEVSLDPRLGGLL